eukprot:m.345947 g.345947  ORF g.345947 m.345947 type:complete len:112 (+) comp16561_c0_seq18:939-1274(+)
MDGEVSVGLTARLSRENDNIDSARLTRRDATRKRNGVVERCSQDLSGSKNASYGQSSVDEGKRAVGHVGCMRGARSPEWRRSSAPDQVRPLHHAPWPIPLAPEAATNKHQS